MTTILLYDEHVLLHDERLLLYDERLLLYDEHILLHDERLYNPIDELAPERIVIILYTHCCWLQYYCILSRNLLKTPKVPKPW